MTQRRALVLLTLVFAGEAVFALPFVLPRVFRPTLLDVFGIDNLQLGAAFSVYGFVAMASYVLGGPLADRFSTRAMMAVALWSTAAGGLFLATIPGPGALIALYGFWGVTTILLFWAGLIRATREWGGADRQGRAYGLLDGGRGLFAALLSTVAVAIFAGSLSGDGSLELRRSAFQQVILATSALTAVAGAAVWWLLPEPSGKGSEGLRLPAVLVLVRRPAIWLQAAIIICAYVGYKGTDDLSLLASDALGYTDVEAAVVGTLAFWIRPVAAIGAGVLADWFSGSRILAVAFGLLVVGDLGVAAGALSLAPALLFTSIVGTCAAVFALRGVYFAVFEEARVPVGLTGTAVGIVSLVGYTPDVFFGPLMGWILDRTPGAMGHVHLFIVLAGFAAVGLLTTLGFGALAARKR